MTDAPVKLSVADLTKRFGSLVAVDGVSCLREQLSRGLLAHDIFIAIG